MNLESRERYVLSGEVFPLFLRLLSMKIESDNTALQTRFSDTLQH